MVKSIWPSKWCSFSLGSIKGQSSSLTTGEQQPCRQKHIDHIVQTEWQRELCLQKTQGTLMKAYANLIVAHSLKKTTSFLLRWVFTWLTTDLECVCVRAEGPGTIACVSFGPYMRGASHVLAFMHMWLNVCKALGGETLVNKMKPKYADERGWFGTQCQFVGTDDNLWGWKK